MSRKFSIYRTKEFVQLILLGIAGVAILGLLCIGVYQHFESRSFVGEQVSIDGKTLTITASKGSKVILSDRTEMNLTLAKQLLVKNPSRK